MIKVDESDPVGEVEPSFPPRDVQIKRNTNVRDFYDLQTEIGRGKFGTVFRCREKATGLALAAKLVSVARREDRRNVEREVDIMRSLQHPRLIQMYDAFEFEQTVCVVLELIEGGELFERVIDDDFVLTEKACTVFMRQICEGMDFVHTQKILHLDLKPENILCLTKTGNRIKIIDFGLARRYEPGKKLQVLFGTPEFVAPEVVNFDQIGFNTDMWSVGVICYVLLSGLSPFMGDTDIETMANVTVAKYDFDDEVFDDISEDAKDFISKLLVKEKEKRMCTTMCLHHKWLRRPKAPKTPTKPIPIESPKKSLSANLIVEPEMRGSKGNLRSTVERWTEHPEDPYIFDTACHVISPCPSLVSVLSAEPQVDALPALPTPPLSPALNQPSAPLKPTNLLHDRLLASTERRASDSSCMRLKSHHIDINDRINLADEIRKLSDKLFRMASQSTESVVATENGRTKTTTTLTTTTTTFVQPANGGDPISTTSKSKIVKTKYNRNNSVLGSCFTAKASSNQIPTKKFWPIEPGRIQVDGTINPEEEAAILAAGVRNNKRRLSKDAIRPTRTLSSTSSNTTHSAPPSPRWSPDPELPPPPTSELTKDLLMRLFEKLDSNHHDEWRLGSDMLSSASRLLFRSPRPSLVIDKKQTLITTHSGGV